MATGSISESFIFKPEIVLVKRKKDFKHILFKLSFTVWRHKKFGFR